MVLGEGPNWSRRVLSKKFKICDPPFYECHQIPNFNSTDRLLPFFGILWLCGIQADPRLGRHGMSYLPRSRGDSPICWAEDWARTRPFIEAAERFIGILCLVSDIRLRVSLSSLSRTGPCQTKADFQFSFTHCIVNINSLWSWYQSFVTDIDKKERKMDVDF